MRRGIREVLGGSRWAASKHQRTKRGHCGRVGAPIGAATAIKRGIVSSIYPNMRSLGGAIDHQRDGMDASICDGRGRIIEIPQGAGVRQLKPQRAC